MPIPTISSTQLSRNPRAALPAARRGPVIITDRGKPRYVLLTFRAYEKLAGNLSIDRER
jgi:prevent-host-death family protein